MNKINEAIVIDLIRKCNIDVDESQLELSKPLHESGLDSLDMATLIMKIDESYDLETPDSVYDSLLTIGNIIEYVNSKVS